MLCSPALACWQDMCSPARCRKALTLSHLDASGHQHPGHVLPEPQNLHSTVMCHAAEPPAEVEEAIGAAATSAAFNDWVAAHGNVTDTTLKPKASAAAALAPAAITAAEVDVVVAVPGAMSELDALMAGASWCHSVRVPVSNLSARSALR